MAALKDDTERQQVQWNLFWKSFHEQFPTAVGKKRRQAMFSIARDLLAENVTPSDVLEANIVVAETHRRHIKKSDYAIIALILFVALWLWSWLVSQTPALEEDEVAKTKFFDEFLERLENAADNNPEDMWPFLPAQPPLDVSFELTAPPERIRRRTPKQSQSETSGAQKPARRKPAKPQPKKGKKDS